MNIIIAALLTLCVSAFAADKKSTKSAKAEKAAVHREHGAHVHGHATLAIAFQGHEGTVEFNSPAESVMGFEHAAKSEADVKTKADAIAKFEKEISKVVEFEKDYKCVFKKDRIEQVMEEGDHSDFVATFGVKCDRSPDASTVKITIQSFFPNVKETEVTLLLGALQKSVKVTTKTESIKID